MLKQIVYYVETKGSTVVNKRFKHAETNVWIIQGGSEYSEKTVANEHYFTINLPILASVMQIVAKYLLFLRTISEEISFD